jgi:tetratricopeptide (TPR) repeat protein
VSWCEATGRDDVALRIVVLLENFWTNSAPTEGLRWLDRLLPRAQVPRQLRAQALRVVGSAAAMAGDDERAEHASAESLAEARAIGDELAAAIALHRVAVAALKRQDRDSARHLAEESLALAVRLSFPKLELQALGTLGDIRWADGDHEAAIELLLRSAELAEQVDFAWWRAGVLLSLAEHGAELEWLGAAERWAQQGVEIGRSIRGRLLLVEGLAVLAGIARRRGALARAGLLWGAVEAEEVRAPLGAWDGYRAEFAAGVVCLDESFAAGRAEGRKLTLDAAIEHALGAIE